MLALGVCENPMVGKSRVPENFEIPEGIEFPENFENSAIISRTTLQCCIAVDKICKYTVEFLVPVKLLETRILRIVRPDVYKRVTACLVLGHYVRC